MAKQSPPQLIVNSLECSRSVEHIHRCLKSTVCYANELGLISIPLFSIKNNITQPGLCVYLAPDWRL